MFDIDNLLLFLFFTISFLGILCAIVLLVLNRIDRHANRLLALGLFNISVVLILNGLTYVKGFYLSYPHSYRIGICSQYLLAPFFYLYVRATVNKETQFRKWDWLHFIPAALHFIEFIPFYLMPTQQKVAYLKYAFAHIEVLSQQKEGLLPAGMHPLLKTATGMVYEFFQTRLLIQFYKKKQQWLEWNRIIWNWLVQLTFFHSLTYSFVLIALFMNTGGDLRMYSILSLGIIQFFCTITLLFNPRVLYGIKENSDQTQPLVTEEVEVQTEVEVEAESVPKKFVLSFVKKQLYKKKIEAFIENEKPYLKKKYSIREFAVDCDIPVHHLSNVINGEYDCNYTDFINGYRINFIITHRYEEKWMSLSLEGLASEAGFNSRNSFLAAFKKVTGQTPAVFFAEKKHKSKSCQNEFCSTKESGKIS